MSDVSESLRLHTKNERPWAICSGHSEEMSDCERIAQVAHQKLLIHLFLGKNERFTQKKDERIPSPDSVVQYSSSGPPPSLYAMKMAFFIWYSSQATLKL